MVPRRPPETGGGPRSQPESAPTAMQLVSSVLEAPDFTAVQELFHSRGWTDGLPVVPPTEEAVAACLEAAVMAPGHVLGVEPVRGRAVTAEKVAVNTVMAGGLPLHFPVIVTALSAMLREEFSLHGATASTGGCAVLVIVNGDERLRLGMDGTFNALGNSDRASAVVGRAVRLCLINLFGVRPGGIDRSTLGHPGKFSFCIAEDEEGSPWEPLAVERGIPDGASAVTVMAAGAPRQIMNEWTTEPEEILETFAAEIRANMRQYSIWPGNYAVVMPPQLREHFAAAGWSRADVRECLFERARIRRAEWATVGKGRVVGGKGEREYRALPDPAHLLLVAAGGPAGGFGAVIPPWLGDKSRAVTLAVGACLDCEAPADGANGSMYENVPATSRGG